MLQGLPPAVARLTALRVRSLPNRRACVGCSNCDAMEKGTAYGEEHVRLVWEEPSEMLMTGLPFRVGLSAVGEDKELIQDYHGHLTITAVTSKLCLAEGFEGRRLGLWCDAPSAGSAAPRRVLCLLLRRAPFAAGCPTTCRATTSTGLMTPSAPTTRASRSSSRVATTPTSG